ncbi:efflux transporter outer membrane subunit [Asticcacaulis sp. ZE23SCel15]|uniref:efflux transporter outer membrane subunit n=1 Tax=Asticcacaulis sp. ZE23SCel15 TaxID=3059027 RepID=UPI00265D936F|nr:efflux transporter outer membrane subunit [Asticcacaulis sp. ZE23SCel15]WKL56325.1 efflux transporter outer membrane subunit [Asticcacaulis sp. ZE23SCel15]
MTRIKSVVLLTTTSVLGALALSACTLAPKYERPLMPVAQSWPIAPDTTGTASAESLPWKDVFLDLALQSTIDLALKNNRDLRQAVLNVELARAQYRIQRASLVPALDAAVSGTKADTPASGETESYSANLGLSYELDLFGRVRSLSRAALESYFATDEARRSAQISLMAETANAWLALAADQDLLRLSRDTLKAREDGYNLTKRSFDLGVADQLQLRQLEILTEQARSDVATLTAQVERDKNALTLLVGSEIPADYLPTSFPQTGAVRSDLSVGLPSEVLINRPDVVAAEHDLKSQNANIGAARAAFFPRISLTGSTGSVSPEFGDLFSSGTSTWSFTPQVSVPIFAGGANRANLRGARVQRDILVAAYEKAIQSAFRDVADALATKSTIDQQISASERVVAAATDSQRLAQARFDRGVDSYITLLDSQRTLYQSQQGLIQARYNRSANLVDLYRALGGGLVSDTGTDVAAANQ